MDDCIFCKIISGELPCNKIYEDEEILAFLDINPIAKGHTLVIPKKHCLDIFDIDDDSVEKVARVCKNISVAMQKGIGAEGINILHASKKVAQQTVFHFHMHVVPRFSDDSIKAFPKPAYSYDDASKIAEMISQVLI